MTAPETASIAPKTDKPMSAPAPQPSSAAVMPTYARANVVFERGEGSWLISTTGERYLDFGSGVAVNALGHAHPKLVAALTEQASKLWHCSNLYRVAGQEQVAARLIEATFADTVFFCNSGAEACEGAIKLARRYHYANGHPERWRTITFKGAFHGRTLATIAAARNPKHLEGFGEPADGFDSVTLGDLEATEAAIGPNTGAIMVEPVQGEGGVNALPPAWLKGLRELCDRHGLLLILDEVQTGVGRTGKLFAHEWAGITPDAMAIAKGIGGGFPLGAVLATKEAAKGMVAGTHGSTFGGNPLASAVGAEVVAMLETGEFQQRAVEIGALLEEGLRPLIGEGLQGLRIRGAWAGVDVDPLLMTGRQMCEALMHRSVLAKDTHGSTLRFAPPLVASDDDVRLMVDAVRDVLRAG